MEHVYEIHILQLLGKPQKYQYSMFAKVKETLKNMNKFHKIISKDVPGF